MWDYLRARKEGRASSGNGRRQSYQDLPMVRMTNTFLLAGDEDPDEIVAQTPHGVYVAQLGGGQVNTATGDFVFGMTEAYLIENGHITEPIRDANLIGNGPDVLSKIDAIGNDFDMSPGTCGKDGQSVPVGCGQPTLARHRRHDRRHRRCLSCSTSPGVSPSRRSGDEEVEVYVAHGRETSIRVFEGEIEQLTSAESAGVGVRVDLGEEDRVSPTSGRSTRRPRPRPWPRRATTPASPRSTSMPASPRPTASSRPRSTCGERSSSRSRPTTRSRSPSSSSGASGPATPASARSSRRTTSTASGRRPSPPLAGIEVTSRRTGCYLFVHAVAGDGDDTQTGFGYSVGRASGRPRPRGRRQRCRRPRDPTARREEAQEREADRRPRPAGDGHAARDPRRHALGRGGRKGSLAVRRARRREGRRRRADPRRRPDEPARLRRLASTTPRGWPAGATRSIAGGELKGFLYDTYAGRLAGTASTGSAVRGGFRTTPGVGAQALLARARELTTRPRSSRRSADGLPRPVDHRRPLRASTA